MLQNTDFKLSIFSIGITCCAAKDETGITPLKMKQEADREKDYNVIELIYDYLQQINA